MRAAIIGVVVEAAAIAPAALSPWGHAGPRWPLAWLSLLLNLPGVLVVRLLRGYAPGESLNALLAGVFVVQAVIISYLVFVYLRRRKLKA